MAPRTGCINSPAYVLTAQPWCCARRHCRAASATLLNPPAPLGLAARQAPEVERCPLKRTSHENKYNPSLAYTASADIWSVGVLAYEMLVGFLPFVSEANEMPPKAGGDGVAVAAFMAAEANTRALSFPSSLSEPARDFIRAALSENPCDRPTVEQLLQHPWIVPALEKHEVGGAGACMRRFENA